MSKPTKRQRADIFTEELTWERFRATCQRCGVVATESRQKFAVALLNQKCNPECPRRASIERRG